MWSSKDLTLVIVTAVVVFITSITVFQIPFILTGINGIGYVTTVGMGFFISLTFLLFEGRRWRFLAHNTLVVILSLPTSFLAPPFVIFPRLVIFLVGIPVDIIVNSFYQKFLNSNKLVWWSIFSALTFFLITPIFQLLLYPLYFPPEFMGAFSNILIVMSPWILGGCVAGGYFGYKLYQKLNNVRNC
ncbi:MAG: hypothetical protein P8X87_08060 [Candidatus Bathyarchaeota archaeon]